MVGFERPVSNAFKCSRCGHKETTHFLPAHTEEISVSVQGSLKVEVPIVFDVMFSCNKCGNMEQIKTQDSDFIKAYLEWWESYL